MIGCAHTKAINDTLGAEVAAATYVGMVRFPEQSQTNRYPTRFTVANVDESSPGLAFRPIAQNLS